MVHVERVPPLHVVSEIVTDSHATTLNFCPV
jgi:hypothetical protein